MKKLLLFLFFLSTKIIAQGTYTSSNYAVVGDTFYLTSASNLALDFTTTGTNYTWDFTTLTGTSQNTLQFRNPTATGFNLFTFPFIFSSSNTNLSSTDGTSNSLSTTGTSIGVSDTNDYYKKTSSELREVASSFKIGYNGVVIPVTNQYSSPDVIATFPLNFGTTNSSNGGYTTSIPSLYYQNKTIARTNLIDGWGTVSTPFGTFSNALRMTTDIVENDTIAVAGIGLPRVIRTSRELKWFDASKKYPVLIVTQNNTAGNWVTTKVQYFDNLTYFQINALFAYNPIAPTAGSTVYFQNLSTNGTTYSWNFDDSTSGTSNTSTLENPNHIFNANGTYQVTLTVSNPNYTATITIPVVVSNVLSNNQNDLVKNNSVYPNPFKDFITFSNPNSNDSYKLISLDGKIIYEGNAIMNQNFSELTNGVYLIKVLNEGKVSFYKIIKN
ncbi:PKD domain-containing protein [Flavobacterium sp. SUN052]|uniref:PKD domain-containing protein n=1 Tax=Flavobacterium sp. SUN052 TaxID=3002441 RepID=UPI00237DAD19|nr:PKD domain-containing protein [Flavobacterium sp. SUN052]MEC4005701.1 PKD domain-containing protein [Flavobacterium sp. SUN052]